MGRAPKAARVRVGITDFAQDALGDVVYVDLPEVGTEVDGEPAFGEVESTKSVSDVFSPVAGTIVERNPLLDERPELVNEQPYGDGWLVVIEVARPGAGRAAAGCRRPTARSSSDGARSAPSRLRPRPARVEPDRRPVEG